MSGGEIAALTPEGPGHQFVFYGDACSGVPAAPHEASFAATNAVLRRLSPGPEFIVFASDEIVGLTADEAALRAQWRHWLDVEMAWLDRDATPLYHATSNHATWDAMSERVFAETLAHLPRNGPPGQEGLSFFVRRGDLLMVFANTCWSGLGGEGHVECEWLAATLQRHADARHKLVVGHHPVWPVNGFSGARQREIAPEHGRPFWRVLVENGVLAYLCGHILAFDVQVHDGVLQLLSAGAGTAHRMPEGAEYLHCVQAALDDDGLRYQVLDQAGRAREGLSWPPRLAPSGEWRRLDPGGPPAVATPLTAWRLRGTTAAGAAGPAETLLSAWSPGPALAPLWIGLAGPGRRLAAVLAPEPGRSPHYWLGPELAAGAPFDLQLALHAEMGPGGIMWRAGDGAPWSSLAAASPWGAERLGPLDCWAIGHGQAGPGDRPFRGEGLSISMFQALG